MMHDPLEPTREWSHIAAELRAYRASQQEAWGDVDNATLGLYLADQASGEERARVESALAEHPQLRELTDLVRDVLAEADAPMVLPMRPMKVGSPRRLVFARRAALVAAACLLLSLGVSLPLLSSPESASIGLADSVADRGTASLLPPNGFYVEDGPTLLAARRLSNAAPDRLEWRRNPQDALALATALHDPAVFYSHSNTKSVRDDDGPLRLAPTAPAPPDTRGSRKSSGWLGPRVDQADPADVRQNVLPVLTWGLQHAPRPEDRETFTKALARLGPVARDAAPMLTNCYHRAEKPGERRAVIEAIGQMGPAAPPDAIPILVTSLKLPSPETRKAAGDALMQLGPLARQAEPYLAEAARASDEAVREQARSLLQRLNGPETRIGVKDAGGCFNVHTIRYAARQVQQLALAEGLEVFVETLPSRPADAGRRTWDELAEIRAGKVGTRGVYLLICKEPPAVAVHVGDALSRRGFTSADTDRLVDSLRPRLNRKDFPGLLRASLQFVSARATSQRRSVGLLAGPAAELAR